MTENLIILPFIDYTAEFKDVMRNWIVDLEKRPSRPRSTKEEYLEMIKVAENIIKSKLRTVDKVWALAIKKQ